MKLPLNVLVGVAVLVVAVVVLVTFFVTSGGSAISQTGLTNVFTQNCLVICDRADRTTITLAAVYPEWQDACEKLYSVPRGASLQCLDRCECGRLSTPCEFLCSFKDMLADWNGFCAGIKVKSAAIYGRCDCRCA